MALVEHLVGRLLIRAQKTTTFYARYHNACADVQSSGALSALQKFPLLTRSQVHHEQARITANTGSTAGWRFVETSGSTGEPVKIILDEMARSVEAAVLSGFIDRCLRSKVWRQRNLLHLVLHAGAASRAMVSPWAQRGQIVKWNLSGLWSADDSSFCAGMRCLGGQIITGMPSVFELIAKRMRSWTEAGGPPPRLILLSGEAVEAAVRQLIASAFSCPVATMYTAAEVGVVGTECLTDGGYHIEPSAVFAEILDDRGNPAPPGTEGNVVVTPLANMAMPLIRYQIGDRASWAAHPCKCKRGSPRLFLGKAKRSVHLVSSSGVALNVVRFAKLFCALGWERYSIQQPTRGVVLIKYKAPRFLKSCEQDVITAAVRAGLGPNVRVLTKRSSFSTSARAASQRAIPPNTQASTRTAGPTGVGIGQLRTWLRSRLAGERFIEIALLTGTALDRTTMSRFSDIDLVLLGSHDLDPLRLRKFADSLRASVPSLSVMSDNLTGLEKRAPLFSCRLHLEQCPLVGHLDSNTLPWPPMEALRTEGYFWVLDAIAAVRHQMINSQASSGDPIYEAWRASKYIFDALRYRFLLRGIRCTVPSALIGQVQKEGFMGDQWTRNFIQLVEVAREHRPPPVAATNQHYSFLSTALDCMHILAREIEAS